MLQVLDRWMHRRRNALGTSKHRWQEQGLKKAVCTFEDRGQSSSIERKDGAYPIISFCLIMYVSTCFSLVSNLVHNATRLSLSNEPFQLIKSCVFLCSWCAHLLLTKPLHQEFFGVFLFFPKKASMTPCFHKDFWEIKALINWCLF